MKYCVDCDIEMEPNTIQVCDDKKKVCSECGGDDLNDIYECDECHDYFPEFRMEMGMSGYDGVEWQVCSDCYEAAKSRAEYAREERQRPKLRFSIGGRNEY